MSCVCWSVQVSGSKFCYLKNEAVLLEMGLINWAFSEVMKRGFTPLITPEIVRSSVVEKCGFQPRGQNTQVRHVFVIFCVSGFYALVIEMFCNFFVSGFYKSVFEYKCHYQMHMLFCSL